MSSNYGIHWFRRDLRIAGNPALRKNWSKNNGRVVGLFCFDKNFLSRPDFSFNRFQFFINTMKSLKAELQASGGDLLVLGEPPQKALPELFKRLKAEVGLPATFSWNRDYEPFARKRDQEVKAICDDFAIPWLTERDHLLIEPNEVFKGVNPKDGYQVYSPFSRKWLEQFKTSYVQKRVSEKEVGLSFLKASAEKNFNAVFKLSWVELVGKPFCESQDQLETFYEENKKSVTVPIPEVGSKAVLLLLERFKSKIDGYSSHRDIPSLEGTSGFSMYLKNGSLTMAQIIAFLKLRPYEKKAITDRDKFFSELIWREFYYHILYRHPNVETGSFLPQYKNLNWDNDEDLFELWKEGKTGFPIVDAGMRELKNTGWMHNRVRMIVASFLTKDLLINWQWGEKYFMETLLDGDLAPNNGGWQWAASTGCDPQPYFRIFNPWSQSKKFDPDGVYIKKFVPELNNYPSEKLHDPIIDHEKYPAPIVDHKVQREKALVIYKSARELVL